MDSVQKKNVEFSPVHSRCLQTKYCLWVLENCCAFDAVMSLCRGDGGRQNAPVTDMVSHNNHHKEVRGKSNTHEKVGIMLSRDPQSSRT